jgi:hypothetical protein
MKPGYKMRECLLVDGVILPCIPGKPNAIALPGGSQINKQVLINRLIRERRVFSVVLHPIADAPANID